jgi:hypothetical protein
MAEDRMFKAFLDTRHHGYELRMWINGVDLGIKGADMNQDIKLFSTDHPLKEQFDDAPPFVTEDLRFIIEEGENTIRVEWKKFEEEHPTNPEYLNLVINSFDYPSPLFFHYTEGDESGEFERTIDITFDSPQEYETVIGNLGPGFVHFAGQTVGTQFELNGEEGGGTGGLIMSTSVLLPAFQQYRPKIGENELVVKYETDGSGPVSYLIVAPGLRKRVEITESGDKYDTHRFTVS